MTASEIVRILEAHGWVLARTKGSHHAYEKLGHRPIPVPFHGNEDLGDFGKRILGEAGIKIKRKKKKEG
jgi:predicted RNA binding protein YcfA (HicA-like mRNA interferase family)